MTVGRHLAQLSPHLSIRELDCRDGNHYPIEWLFLARQVALEFECIRAMLDHRPMMVGSAYRTWAHNIAVDGAEDSRHLYGDALDNYPPVGCAVSTLFQAVLDRANQPGSLIKGIGRYRTFVHWDLRPSFTLVLWEGDRVDSEGERSS
jgi:hypothetical protein